MSDVKPEESAACADGVQTPSSDDDMPSDPPFLVRHYAAVPVKFRGRGPQPPAPVFRIFCRDEDALQAMRDTSTAVLAGYTEISSECMPAFFFMRASNKRKLPPSTARKQEDEDSGDKRPNAPDTHDSSAE
jgi:hypothetical protein